MVAENVNDVVAEIARILEAQAKEKNVDWPNVGNDKGAMRYSKLDQINRRNVKNLEVAWVYHTGDAAKGNGSTIECTPIIINGVLYLTTAKSKVAALDADTGCERWKFDPYADFKPTQPLASGGVNRGVVEVIPLSYTSHPLSEGALLCL